MGMKELIKRIPGLDELYIRIKWREKRRKLGNENPDKIFYVIRRATCKVGLFSYVMTNMGLVKYALERGYIPVIDMQENGNTYLEADEVGKKNAWEFYFEQPCGYGLTDIAESRNVIYSSGLITEGTVYPVRETIFAEDTGKEWRELFHCYLRPNREIRQEADLLFDSLFEGKKVLGVLCRGTDYLNNHPKNHPVQPEPQAVIEKAGQVMKEFECDYLYLATEDEDIYAQFRKTFGDRLKVTEARRYQDTGTANINEVSCQREGGRYLKGKEYLINMILLSKCSCLVAGAVGGTYGAYLMSEGYEYEFVYDLGVY